MTASTTPATAVCVRLTCAMGLCEGRLARGVEQYLYPSGAPSSVTVAGILDALCAGLDRQARALLDVETSLDAAVRRAGAASARRSDSAISVATATRLAQIDEMTRRIRSTSAERGARLEDELFGGPAPAGTTVLAVLCSLRLRVELEIAQANTDEHEDLVEFAGLVCEILRNLAQICGEPVPELDSVAPVLGVVDPGGE